MAEDTTAKAETPTFEQAVAERDAALAQATASEGKYRSLQSKYDRQSKGDAAVQGLSDKVETILEVLTNSDVFSDQEEVFQKAKVRNQIGAAQEAAATEAQSEIADMISEAGMDESDDRFDKAVDAFSNRNFAEARRLVRLETSKAKADPRSIDEIVAETVKTRLEEMGAYSADKGGETRVGSGRQITVEEFQALSPAERLLRIDDMKSLMQKG